MLGESVSLKDNYPDGITWCNFGRNIDWMREYRKKYSTNSIEFLLHMMKRFDQYAMFDRRDLYPSITEWKKMIVRCIWIFFKRIGIKNKRAYNQK